MSLATATHCVRCFATDDVYAPLTRDGRRSAALCGECAHILRKRYRHQPWADAAAVGPETEAELRCAFGDR